MLKALDVGTWINQRRSNLDEAKKSAAEIINVIRNEGGRSPHKDGKKV